MKALAKIYTVSRIVSGRLKEPEICRSISGARKVLESLIPDEFREDYNKKTEGRDLQKIIASMIRNGTGAFTLKLTNNAEKEIVFRIDQHKIKIGVSL